MTKVRTTLLDIPDLENLDLVTETRDGKRHYIDSEGTHIQVRPWFKD